jgi:twitching motility protein PilT
MFRSNKSLIEQREVWVTTLSFENWLKYALRQAPDVIMVWEMRDLESFRLALRAAETWNLVFATLHTSWASKTISRVIDMFPWDEKTQIRAQLSESLVWVIWQELVKKNWWWRVVLPEILINNTSISNMIRENKIHQIDWAIETWQKYWMLPMKKSLDYLFSKWIILKETLESSVLKLLWDR